jgi:hypothetical protein
MAEAWGALPMVDLRHSDQLAIPQRGWEVDYQLVNEFRSAVKALETDASTSFPTIDAPVEPEPGSGAA